MKFKLSFCLFFLFTNTIVVSQSILPFDNSNLHKGHNNFTGKDETHIKIILTKKNAISINRLNIHRIINNLLQEEFKSGLHSLEIKIN